VKSGYSILILVFVSLLSLAIVTDAQLRAHIGRGYRSPSLFERFGTGFDATFGYSIYGDPALHPERSIAIDGGLDQSFLHESVRTSATYFYTRLQDVILFSTLNPGDPFGRFFGYTNAKGGLARGAELSSLISANRSLDLSAAYTYTNAIERTPVVAGVLRSVLTPEHQFSLTASQRIGERVLVAFDFTAASSYLAQIFGATASPMYRFHGIRRAGLGVSYRHPLSEFRAVRFFAKIDNLLNQNYYEQRFRTPGATGVGGAELSF